MLSFIINLRCRLFVYKVFPPKGSKYLFKILFLKNKTISWK